MLAVQRARSRNLGGMVQPLHDRVGELNHRPLTGPFPLSHKPDRHRRSVERRGGTSRSRRWRSRRLRIWPVPASRKRDRVPRRGGEDVDRACRAGVHHGRRRADPAGNAFTGGRCGGEVSSPAGSTFHDLRHFYASLLIHHGESVTVVQARLGHATAAETLDYVLASVAGLRGPDPGRRRLGARSRGISTERGESQIVKAQVKAETVREPADKPDTEGGVP